MTALGVGEMKVFDEAGEEHTMAELCDNRKAIVVFDLAKVPQDHLGNVAVVVIGCAPHRFIAPFKKETNFPFELYSDPDRNVYKSLGLKHAHASASKSEHMRSSVVMGLLQSTWRGLKSMRMQGDVKQQGGAFVVDQKKLIFSHQDKSPDDHCPINTLLTKAGLETFF
ncbi:hypothetical protein PTSG_04672 [Salpingoeca rosetta]|uniref:Uncharacterized protein n=1 Tax=Salpingoeca rosetta (strain ATCC 50818 / BSB-021) TaxID=946362 RepID=F2U835_SALR5|nr:uncharacterized protein PTSG_04672 [Salpingoeca rosetta]EGD72940.1 hypothetical protein PTSG_04672 [Salpingoeca rosetta]|eukprot:XP_004994762.1 hypothetical protein PTSG_04672 [Salpingoeca rosetta]